MKLRNWLFYFIPSSIALLFLLAVVIPSWREQIQGLFSTSGREVLAVAEGDLLNDGTQAKVLKIRSPDGLYVEILKMGTSGATTLVDRILLPDKHDGLFNYQGHVTRLAIADLSNDGKMVLLAPTFDNQLVPHLNVFRYNSAVGRFELVQPPK